MRRKRLFGTLCLLAVVFMGFSVVSAAVNGNTTSKQQSPQPDKVATDTKKSVKEVQAEFRKLEFGMFIHYNMATYKGAQWVAGYPVPPTSIRAARSTPTPGRTRRCPPA